MGDGKLKVTDNRIFTEEGELREGFEHLGEDSSESPESEATQRPESAQPSGDAAPPPQPQRPRAEPPQPNIAGGRALPDPRFMDLIAVLAEPVALFLGDAQLPDGSSAEDLDRARFYIDLLEALNVKTQGNLDAQEAAVLEDIIYRLRLRYVEKQG